MKVSATIICMCLTLLLWCAGCSKEEPPPPPVKKHKVVMPIKRPAPEKAETSLPSKEEKAEEEIKEAAEVKTATVREETIKPPETETIEKTAVDEEAGHYIIKEGDSLSSISGRDDVYGDPLKWPILYRLNMDKLAELQVAEGFLDRELPEGLRLKIITPEEARENVKRRPHNVWVVNVLSATTNGEIVPIAIRLIRNGFPVYIARARVKGRDWKRLRVGFFKSETEAKREVRKIMTLLNLDNSWVTKIGKEFEEFGGY